MASDRQCSRPPVLALSRELPPVGRRGSLPALLASVCCHGKSVDHWEATTLYLRRIEG
jgi:hypothetical protein